MTTTTIYTDRSRIETYQRCPRARFLNYHQDGLGITSAKKPLPLAVGGSVHVGLATLLSGGDESEAVSAALSDFAQYAARLDLPDGEQLAPPAEGEDVELRQQFEQSVSQADEYLYHEQAALIEGLVRAYARRRLRPLLEEYEVLEVEREGTWQLADLSRPRATQNAVDGLDTPAMEDWASVVFMSRPDALLLNRRTRSLELLSYKTAASWDVRKERDAQHDMQGLSEAIEVEQRLGEWWHEVNYEGASDRLANLPTSLEIPQNIWKYLATLPAPPRILAVRYEYILKGERRKDKDLSARLGFEARTQSSLLTRAYLNAGMTSGDEQWNWSYDYIKEDGAASKLYAKNWPARAVWEHLPTKAWVDMLDATMMATGEENREMGWQGPAQSSGFTSDHPLDSLFVAPLIVNRNDDDLRDLVEQMEAQETKVAEGVAAVNAAGDDGERRHLLNLHFGQSRRACSYPTLCQFEKICYGGEAIRQDPRGGGLFVLREPHHTPETTATHAAAKAR